VDIKEVHAAITSLLFHFDRFVFYCCRSDRDAFPTAIKPLGKQRLASAAILSPARQLGSGKDLDKTIAVAYVSVVRGVREPPMTEVSSARLFYGWWRVVAVFLNLFFAVGVAPSRAKRAKWWDIWVSGSSSDCRKDDSPSFWRPSAICKRPLV
jgi:hypothetical protein